MLELINHIITTLATDTVTNPDINLDANPATTITKTTEGTTREFEAGCIKLATLIQVIDSLTPANPKRFYRPDRIP